MSEVFFIPTYRFTTEINTVPFENPSNDDFIITIGEVPPEGPVIYISKFNGNAHVPVADESLSYYIIKRLMVLKDENIYKTGTKFYIRITYQDILH